MHFSIILLAASVLASSDEALNIQCGNARCERTEGRPEVYNYIVPDPMVRDVCFLMSRITESALLQLTVFSEGTVRVPPVLPDIIPLS